MASGNRSRVLPDVYKTNLQIFLAYQFVGRLFQIEYPMMCWPVAAEYGVLQYSSSQLPKFVAELEIESDIIPPILKISVDSGNLAGKPYSSA